MFTFVRDGTSKSCEVETINFDSFSAVNTRSTYSDLQVADALCIFMTQLCSTLCFHLYLDSSKCFLPGRTIESLQITSDSISNLKVTSQSLDVARVVFQRHELS